MAFTIPRATTLTFLFVVTIFWLNNHIYAQDWAKPVNRQQQRMDLRDLGYPMINEIPANSTAITSLMTSRSGLIYGCTSGESSYLFVFDPIKNKAKHLGIIPGHTGVHHALVEDKQGYIYIGTGKNPFEEVPLSEYGERDEKLDATLWKDIKKHFSAYNGGHVYRYDPKYNDTVKLPHQHAALQDLGLAVPNNSIYALTIDSSRDVIYGLSYPDGHFFVYSITGNQFRDLGEIDSVKVYHGPERHWRTLPRALICDDSGRVFTSSTKGKLVFYDPVKKQLVKTSIEIPGDYYYIQFFEDYTSVEYFAKAAKGLIYGGTTDGYLFSFDPVRMILKNLGKVRASRRLRCLSIGKNGKVYLIAGEISPSRPCQMYAYDPASSNFESMGMIIVDRSPYYYKRGQQFDSMTTGVDGTIYLGESERKSGLFIYLPE